MLLCASGVSVSAIPDELEVVMPEKEPQVVIGAPEQLHMYIRPYRYAENNMWAHMEDLWHPVAIRAKPNAARIVVNNKLASSPPFPPAPSFSSSSLGFWAFEVVSFQRLVIV